jgi:hypothetical protein
MLQESQIYVKLHFNGLHQIRQGFNSPVCLVFALHNSPAKDKVSLSLANLLYGDSITRSRRLVPPVGRGFGQGPFQGLGAADLFNLNSAVGIRRSSFNHGFTRMNTDFGRRFSFTLRVSRWFFVKAWYPCPSVSIFGSTALFKLKCCIGKTPAWCGVKIKIVTARFPAILHHPFAEIGRGENGLMRIELMRACRAGLSRRNKTKTEPERRRTTTTSNINPVFRGMLRKIRSLNQRKNCVKHWHQRIIGFGRPFRAPDEALEPQDEAVHLRRAQRHSHH